MTEWVEKVCPSFDHVRLLISARLSTVAQSGTEKEHIQTWFRPALMIVRVKCLPTDTVGDLKKLIAAQTGTTHQKIQLKKW